MGNTVSKINETDTEAPDALLPSTASAQPAITDDTSSSTQEQHDDNTEEEEKRGDKERDDAVTKESEEGDAKEPSPSEVNESVDDFFTREYRDHKWSLGLDVPSRSNPTISELQEKQRIELSEKNFRLLEPGEELLTESESSEEEPESWHQWSLRTCWNFAESDKLTMEEKQLGMDIDKMYSSGNAPAEPRPKSCLEKKWIGDYVERARRIEWAEEMGRRYPGRYVPYPGRAVRPPPSQSAAEKVRQLHREK